MNEGNAMDVTFLGFSKVSHDIFVVNVAKYGLANTTLRLIGCTERALNSGPSLPWMEEVSGGVQAVS